MKHEINAIVTIAYRDIAKLFRDRTRLLANFIFPVIFIGVLGGSLQSNLRESLPYNFMTFVFIGVLAQTLFQSTASGIISLIEDRQNDFAQELFVTPISRFSIIIGKILGETLVSFVQVTNVVLFGLIIGVPLELGALLRTIPFWIVIAFFGGSFGVLVMSNFSDQKSVNQLFPFLLFPQFFLAGVFNPIKVLPFPLLVASRIAPMTYAVDFMRSIYYAGTKEFEYVVINNFYINGLVVIVLFLIFISFGTYIFVKNEKNR